MMNTVCVPVYANHISLPAEIAPLELRHTGAALNACGEWLWSFITVFAAPIGLADPATGPKIWWWFYVGRQTYA